MSPRLGLRQALDVFDEPAAQAVLDRLLADLSVPAVLRDVVMPYLADLGERWQRGTASVAMEHFASNVIRGRLAGLARGCGSGTGRRPCSPARPASCTIWRSWFSASCCNRNGWRIGDLGRAPRSRSWSGPSTPRILSLVVLAATRAAETLEPLRPELASLARRAPLALAGARATPQIASAVGARLMAATQ